jgi:hypothetical protein
MEHETNTLCSRRGNEADMRTTLGIRLLTPAATKAVKYPGWEFLSFLPQGPKQI